MSKHGRFQPTQRARESNIPAKPDTKPEDLAAGGFADHTQGAVVGEMTGTTITQSRPGEISTSERSDSSNAVVVSVISTASDTKLQDERINTMEAAGYRHYESVVIPGNSIILRFRKGAE